MLRFTLHSDRRPHRSTRCHRPSGGDVACGVHVGVVGVAAGPAAEGGLALARLRVGGPARRTCLGCVCRGNLLDPAGALCSRRVTKLAPPVGEDGTVQAGLLSHVPARPLERAPAERVIARTSRSSTRIMSNRRARSVLVFSTQSLRRSASSAFSAMATATLVWRAGSIHAANGRDVAAAGGVVLLSRAAVAGVQELPCRQGRRYLHASVHADDLAVPGRGHRRRDHSERDVPAAGTVPGHPIGRGIRQRAGEPEPHPADLRHQHPRPLPGQLFNPAGLGADDPEPFMRPRLAPRRSPMGAREEVAPGPVEIPQRLLLHRLRARRQPRLSPARLGQLRCLGDIPRRRRSARTPHQPLLHAQVPHESRMRAVIQQQHLLRCRWNQPEPGHTTDRNTNHRHQLGRRERRFVPD